MSDTPRITFGDNVRICRTPETERGGVAGLMGQVHGATTPSVTGVKVVGELRRDCAVAVHFKERGETIWFAEQLIEFVDHAAGTTVEAAGNRWVRSGTGEWIESRDAAAQRTGSAQAALDTARDNRRVKIIIGAVAAVFIIIVLVSILKRL